MLLFFLSLFIFYSFMKIYSAVLNFSLNYVILFQYHNINSYLFRLIERNALIMTKEKSVCFTGHRPEKLPGYGEMNNSLLNMIKSMLYYRIYLAAQSGYEYFISGLARGVDLWAAALSRIPNMGAYLRARIFGR